MGLIGILAGLGVLVWLSFRGWSVLVLAPIAALIAAVAASEPLLANWTMTFMGSAAGFILQFFPLFLLGAVFGKLMDDSGSVTAIAGFMIEKLGPQRAILAVVLAGALVTYGGVSLFVAFFVLVPMAQALFRDARHSEPPDARRRRARHVDVHDVRAAGNAGHPERDSDAVLRDHAVRRARPRHHRVGDHAGLRPVVAGARGKIGARAGEGFGLPAPAAALMRATTNRRFASARPPRAVSIRRKSRMASQASPRRTW